jgi:hypothetical protein
MVSLLSTVAEKLQKKQSFLGYFIQRLSLRINLDKKGWALFGRFFSQTHLVTLPSAANSKKWLF